MANVNLEQLKKLRNQTQASIADCRRALEESDGDYQKALEWLRKHGVEKAAKKEGRKTQAGVVDSYIHHTLRSGATIVLACETDFVARTEEFRNLAHELAMQVTSTDAKSEEALLKQPWIKDETRTVSDILKETIAKLGENITIKEFRRFTI